MKSVSNNRSNLKSSRRKLDIDHVRKLPLKLQNYLLYDCPIRYETKSIEKDYMKLIFELDIEANKAVDLIIEVLKEQQSQESANFFGLDHPNALKLDINKGLDF